MSNPLKSIHVSRIAGAAANIIANTKPHQEYKRAQAMIRESQAIEDARLARSEMVSLEIYPAAEKILASRPRLPENGYFSTHRNLGHLLPQDLKWTVQGVEIINAILAKIPLTAPYMESWKSDIAAHIEETKVNEATKLVNQARHDAENHEVYEMVVAEIIRLFQMQADIRRNYGKLFNYLRTGLPSFFKGARGVRIIHAAMRDKINYSTHWEEYMAKDLAKAEQHDKEYHEKRRLARRGIQAGPSGNRNVQRPEEDVSLLEENEFAIPQEE